MKKTILVLFLLYTTVALQAQEEGSLLLNTYTSKSFTDKVHFDDTYAKVNQGFQWGGFYFGTGGVGAGVSSYSTMYQFGVGGGLVFKLGQ